MKPQVIAGGGRWDRPAAIGRLTRRVRTDIGPSSTRANSQLRALPGAGCCSLPVRCRNDSWRRPGKSSRHTLALGIAWLAFRAAVLVFHDNPVLLVEVEVLDMVAGAELVAEVEIPAFAVSKTRGVDDLLVDPKR